MSESDRMPGYLNRSQVPPRADLPSKIAKDLFGQLFCKLYAAAIPEIPAPTTMTSLCIRMPYLLMREASLIALNSLPSYQFGHFVLFASSLLILKIVSMD